MLPGMHPYEVPPYPRKGFIILVSRWKDRMEQGPMCWIRPCTNWTTDFIHDGLHSIGKYHPSFATGGDSDHTGPFSLSTKPVNRPTWTSWSELVFSAPVWLHQPVVGTQEKSRVGTLNATSQPEDTRNIDCIPAWTPLFDWPCLWDSYPAMSPRLFKDWRRWNSARKVPGRGSSWEFSGIREW